MPYVIKHYAEKTINQIPEYQVSIADVDVHLLKGNYVLKNIRLHKVKANLPVPFFSASKMEIAVEWPALLKGKLVAQINIEEPHLNFVIDPSGENEQLSISQQWQQAVKALSPLNINHIELHEGELTFRSFTSKPPFNLYLSHMNAELTNLHNADSSLDKLPSTLTLTAQTMDGAPFKLEMHFNPFTKTPTFKLTAELKQMQVPAANQFLQHYTKINIKQGLFSLYAEMAAANGKITGYAKPLIKNLQVVEPDKNDMSAIEALYKNAVQVVAKILENSKTKKVATKINIHGDIDDPNIDIWSIVSNLLRNAFIQALLPQLDHSIEMKDINLNSKK